MMKKLMSFALAFTFVFVGASAADAYSGIPEWEGDTGATTDAASDCTKCHYAGASHVPPGNLADAAPHGDSYWTAGETTDDTSCGTTSAGCHGSTIVEEEESDKIYNAIYNAEDHAGSTNCADCHENAPNIVIADDTVDADGDTIGAKMEESLGTSDAVTTGLDSDGDTISDADEVANGTNPASNDTDHDGLFDAYEGTEGYNPAQPGDRNHGTETVKNVEVVTGESISTVIKYDKSNSYPDDLTRPKVGSHKFEYKGEDVDGNGIGTLTYTAVKSEKPTAVGSTDKISWQYVDENGAAQILTVNITVVDAPVDTDGDGILDETDVYPYDFDNDGFTDEVEKAAGTDPKNAQSVPANTDGDKDLDYIDTDDDNDGVSDADENAAGTDPLDKTDFPSPPPTINKPDTDNDGLTDDVDTDDDNDGVSDADEIEDGTNPLDAKDYLNPETGGTAGLMLSLTVATASAAGLVVSRKRK